MQTRMGLGLGLGMTRGGGGEVIPEQHTAGLISEWLFAEGSGTTVNDEIGSNDINLELPTTPNYTWNSRGVALAAGLIQTPSITGARTVVMLCKTNRGGTTGFLSSGAASSGIGLQQVSGTNGEVYHIGGGNGVHPALSRQAILGGTTVDAMYELNRGGYVLVFREMSAQFTTVLGFGGRHSTTTSRCTEFEIVWAGVWNDQLTSDERNTIYQYVAYLAKQRAVYLRNADCPSRYRTILLGGESTADGRSPISSLSAGDQSQVFSKVFIQSSNGNGAGTDMFVPALFDLGVNQQTTAPATNFGPELGFAQAIEVGSETAYIVKTALGSTFLAPQDANGAGLPANTSSWNAGGTPTSGLLWRAVSDYYDAEQSSRSAGVGLNVTGMQFLIGLNDAQNTAYTTSAATYQARLEAMFGAIKTYTSLGSLPVHLPRAHDADPSSNATALGHVRDGQAAFVTAWADGAELMDTDSLGLTDGVHFDAAGSLAIGDAGAAFLLGI